MQKAHWPCLLVNAWTSKQHMRCAIHFILHMNLFNCGMVHALKAMLRLQTLWSFNGQGFVVATTSIVVDRDVVGVLEAHATTE